MAIRLLLVIERESKRLWVSAVQIMNQLHVLGFQLPRTHRPFGQNRANNRPPPRLSEQMNMRAAAAQLKKLRKMYEVFVFKLN